MIEVIAFMTTDGQFHLTEKEANHHELMLSAEKQFDDFFKSDFYPYRDKKSPYGKIVKKCLAGWELYKGQQK